MNYQEFKLDCINSPALTKALAVELAADTPASRAYSAWLRAIQTGSVIDIDTAHWLAVEAHKGWTWNDGSRNCLQRALYSAAWKCSNEEQSRQWARGVADACMGAACDSESVQAELAKQWAAGVAKGAVSEIETMTSVYVKIQRAERSWQIEMFDGAPAGFWK